MNMPEDKKKLRNKKKTQKVLRIPKVIFIMVILWFFGNAIYSFSINSLIQTEFVVQGSIEKKHQADALILKEELVMLAPSSGTIKNIYPEGEKIPKNHELYAIKIDEENPSGKEKELSVKAPISGVVSYTVDGLESDLNMSKLEDLNFKNIANSKTKNVDYAKNDLVKEDHAVCKIIDNLKAFKCYLEIPIDLLENPVEKNDALKIRFPKYNEEVFVSILDINKDKENLGLLVQIPQMCYSLMNERVVDVEIIMNRTEGILIPLKAIVNNENNKKGIYQKKKGTVVWSPIKVVETDEENAIVEGIDSLTEVIINPRWVKEGQYLY